MNVDVFKRTTDDWYPSYLIQGDIRFSKLVEVSFTQTGPNPPITGDWRVCVWGADDCGMERDFQDEAQAWNCFLQVIGWEQVSMQALKDIDFVSA